MIGKTILHYKITEKLGEGGMGVVYKAEDTKLERTVAIKFLPRHIAANSEERERFKIEAKAAAALNHPNITHVYAIEEFDDDLFIVMEFIEGQELKDIVGAQDFAPLPDVLNYATQIASGLQAAHEKEVTHRDIKSSNIMITDKGRVKIMDFGLAKVRGGAQLTKVGTTLGTAAYMSPEQAQGMETDHRTDIWAFGVVLYEMLSGQLPFKGEYDAAMLYSVLHETPAPLQTHHESMPGHVVQIVNKALEKLPAERYQNMADLLSDLQKPTKPKEAEEPKKSIVVMPFENLSPDKDNEYFSDGLTEEIITDLSQLHSLRVISRNSAMLLKDTDKSLKQIGRALDVQYALTGSVRKAGENLRISAQLLDVKDDFNLWADKYKGTTEDIFEIQENVSSSIVETLKLKLTLSEVKKLSERPIEDVKAYEYYFRSRKNLYEYTKSGLDKAVSDLNEALKITGPNELIYAGMGVAHFTYYNAGIEIDRKHLKKAENYRNKIVQLNPDSPYGHHIQALLKYKSHLMKESIGYWEEAIKILPGHADFLVHLSWMYLWVGRNSRSFELLNRLLKIDPLSSFNHCALASYYTMEGKFEDALITLQHAYEMDPDSAIVAAFLGLSLAYNNATEQALSIINQFEQNDPNNTLLMASKFFLLTVQGDEIRALDTVTDEVIKYGEVDELGAFLLAQGYSVLGKTSQAISWVEMTINHGFINYPFLAERDPFLNNIRNNTRFQELMKQVKHEWENFEI